MDRKKYEELLVVIEESIENSVSRGDTHPHEPGRLEEKTKILDSIYNDSDVDSGDSYLDAIGRLYRTVAKG